MGTKCVLRSLLQNSFDMTTDATYDLEFVLTVQQVVPAFQDPVVGGVTWTIDTQNGLLLCYPCWRGSWTNSHCPL